MKKILIQRPNISEITVEIVYNNIKSETYIFPLDDYSIKIINDFPKSWGKKILSHLIKKFKKDSYKKPEANDLPIDSDSIIETVNFNEELEEMDKKMRKPNPTSKPFTTKELIQAIEAISIKNNYSPKLMPFFKEYEEVLTDYVNYSNWEHDEELREKLNFIYYKMINLPKIKKNPKNKDSETIGLNRFIGIFESGIEICVDTNDKKLAKELILEIASKEYHKVDCGRLLELREHKTNIIATN